MEDLRYWWEVPSIAHFCSLFRAAFDLPDFDIEDLENGLFAFCEDQESPFIIDLICRLLRGCYGRNDIESYNYEVYLKDIFKYRSEGDYHNPFEYSDFESLHLRTKVEVLHRLCDFRLEAEDVMERLKGLDGDNMRVSPLGTDDSGATYWYFYGNRLYKEDPEPVIEEEKPKKKKKKEKDKKEVESKSNTSKGKKAKNQKKKAEETPRSRRGRILSKKRNFESSESENSEEEDQNDDSSEDNYVTPAKQQKSQESTPKGRQTRSTQKTRQTETTKVDDKKEQGTRRSTRKSSQFTTPVSQKKSRSRTKKTDTVNGNITDDSDEEWNTPLAKTMSKTRASTKGSRNARNTRQASVDSSDHEIEEEQKPRKRGRPRKAVKITPDSSVNGDVEDQQLDYMEDKDHETESGRTKNRARCRVGSRQSSRRNSIESQEVDADEKNSDIKDGKAEIKDEDNDIDMEVDENSNGNKETSEDTKTVKVEIAESESSSKVKGETVEPESSSEVKGEEVEPESSPKLKDENVESESNSKVKNELIADNNGVKTECKEEECDSVETTAVDQKSSLLNDGSVKQEVKSENEQESHTEQVKKENSNESQDEEDINITEVDVEDQKKKRPPPPKPANIDTRWNLVCSTVEEWQELAESLKDSTTKAAKELYKCIVNDFLPEMPAIMEARERDKKKRQAEMAPRRVSARITMKMKEFQEQVKILEEARQLEEKRRKEEEEEQERLREVERQEEERKMREERQKAREERQKRLELREQRAQLIAEGKEIPPELMYTGNTLNSKYREDDDRCELDREILDDMEKMLDEVKSHKDSWPFLDPVDEEIAPGYHDVIKRPMDLSTIEKKLTGQQYRTTKRFIQDFNLMISNCFQFSGVDSELGRMASRLRKCINKCIRIYLDKNDGDEDDEDFHGGVTTQTEKKWRPRRAATCKAMDTLRGAFNDDEFEEMTSTPGHEYAASTKKKRLIPELSGDTQQRQQVTNGEKIPKLEDSKNSNSQVWKESNEITKETKILTVNGKTFVYKFNTPPANSKKKIVEKPTYSISTSPGKPVRQQLTTGGNITSNTPPRMLIRPQQSGAILPVSSSIGSPSSIATVNTPNGPKIIRIMSPAGLGQGQTAQSIVTTTSGGAAPQRGIRISDGMLLLGGKATGIQISGKTKIIYRGAVSTNATSTPGQNAIIVAGGQGNPTVVNQQGLQTSVRPGQVIQTISTNQGTGQNVILTTGQPVLNQVASQPFVLASSGQSTIAGQNIILAKSGQPVVSNQVVRQNVILPSTGQQSVSNPVSGQNVIFTTGGQPVVLNQVAGQNVILGGQTPVSSQVVRQNVVLTSGQTLVSNQVTGQSVVLTSQQTPMSNQVIGQGVVLTSGQTLTSNQVVGQNVILTASGQPTTKTQVVGQNAVMSANEQIILTGPSNSSTVQNVVNSSNQILTSISSTTNQSPVIKTAQPSVEKVSSIHSENITTLTLVKPVEKPTNVTMTTNMCQTFTLPTTDSSNQNEALSPCIGTVNKSSPSDVNKTPSNSLLGSLKEQKSRLQASILQKHESLMGPPLTIPPKRKLSGSPENKSVLPPKLLVTSSVSSECDSVSPPKTNISSLPASLRTDLSTCDTNESVSNVGLNMNNKNCTSEQFPPYKISHISTSPDKGNLFDILKTNLTESSNSVSEGNKQSSDLNQAGLSKGLMDKVSNFAASLQNRSLAGRLNLPAHLLQKSPTKEQQLPEECVDGIVDINNTVVLNAENPTQNQDSSESC